MLGDEMSVTVCTPKHMVLPLRKLLGITNLNEIVS